MLYQSQVLPKIVQHHSSPPSAPILLSVRTRLTRRRPSKCSPIPPASLTSGGPVASCPTSQVEYKEAKFDICPFDPAISVGLWITPAGIVYGHGIAAPLSTSRCLVLPRPRPR